MPLRLGCLKSFCHSHHGLLGVRHAALTAESGPRVQVHDRPGSSMLQYSWLPLGPALYAFLACQVSGMLGSTLADTQKLRQQMYAHKTA